MKISVRSRVAACVQICTAFSHELPQPASKKHAILKCSIHTTVYLAHNHLLLGVKGRKEDNIPVLPKQDLHNILPHKDIHKSITCNACNAMRA